MAKADPFDALGDPTRREILRLLSEGDKPVQELADALPISRPAVSRHLRLLKEAGLVAEQSEGTRRIYHLQDAGCGPSGTSSSVWGDAAPRFTLAGGEHRAAAAAMTEPLPSASTSMPAEHAFAVWTTRIEPGGRATTQSAPTRPRRLVPGTADGSTSAPRRASGTSGARSRCGSPPPVALPLAPPARPGPRHRCADHLSARVRTHARRHRAQRLGAARRPTAEAWQRPELR